MASKIQGLGVVFGLVGAHQVAAGGCYKDNTTPVVGAVTLSKFNDDAGVTLNFSRDIIFDEDGVPRVALNHGSIWNLEGSFTPKASSIALAEDELFIPLHGATMVVSTMKLGVLNQTYAITGFSLAFVRAGQATYRVSLQFSPEGDIVTPVNS